MSISNQEVKVVVSNVSDVNKVDISTVFSVCSKACSLLNNQKIDKTNIIPFMHAVMESVETFSNINAMTGSQKKDLAMQCIHWLVQNRSSLNDLEKQELEILIDQICPPAIDVIISVANGVSQLIKSKCNSCCVLM